MSVKQTGKTSLLINRNRSACCVGLTLVVCALILVSSDSVQAYEFEPRLLGHGTLYAGPGGCGESYVQVIENCSPECFPALRFSGEPEIAQYINSGTTVYVYGVIANVMWTCQQNEIIAHLYTATPGSCVTPVEETTWGAIKSRYR